jgi:hypothetical protein
MIFLLLAARELLAPRPLDINLIHLDAREEFRA